MQIICTINCYCKYIYGVVLHFVETSKSERLKCRRGISRFYNGRSKSFASLGEASSSSSKDIAKPDNAYIRKRRNLLSYSLNWEKPRLRGNGGAISKRLTSSGRTTLALAVAMTNSDGVGGSLPVKDFTTWRSFSLADLQHCDAVSIPNSIGIDATASK